MSERLVEKYFYYIWQCIKNLALKNYNIKLQILFVKYISFKIESTNVYTNTKVLFSLKISNGRKLQFDLLRIGSR